MVTFSSIPHRGASRADRFRQRYRVGDTLRGELVAYISPDRAWVRIDDLSLVAVIRPGLEPHSTLMFTVQSLRPDIVLAECRIGEPSMHSSIQRFVTARSYFESQMTTALGRNWSQHLHRSLCTNHGLLRSYLTVHAKLRDINAQLDRGQRVAYCPWLLPSLAESVLIFTPTLPGTAIGEILGYGVLSSAEHIWLQATFTSNQYRLRCFAPRSIAAAQYPSQLEWTDPTRCPVQNPWERLLGLSAQSHYQTTL